MVCNYIEDTHDMIRLYILEFTEVSPASEWPCQGSVVPLGPIAPALAPVSEEDVTLCDRRKQIKVPYTPYTEYYNQKWPDFTVLEEIPFWCDPQESMQVYGIITGLGPRMSHGCWKPGPSQAW